MGVHVFQDNMCYESICRKGGNVLCEVMCWWSACFMMAYLAVFLYWKTVLTG